MSIEIPDDVLTSCSAEKVRQEVALALYDQMIITRTQAMAMLGADEAAFFDLAAARGIRLRYDVEDFAQDMQRLRQP